MEYKKLKDEIALPLYSAMTDAQILAELLTKDKIVNKSSISGAEILEACETSAILALVGDKATRVWGIIGMDSIDPFGNAAQVFIDAFGGGSATITALQALRINTVTRADELGFTNLSEQVINDARVGAW